VKFINNNGQESVYMAPGDGGIALLAVHCTDSLFAYTSHVVNPQIHIMQYPSLVQLAALTGLLLVAFKAYLHIRFGT